MRALTVINPGVMSSVQDLGRFGHASIGVSTSGAADTLSLRIANRLLGNNDNDSAIETTLTGATFAFNSPQRIAIAGASAQVSLIRKGATRNVGVCRPLDVQPNDQIRIGPPTRGVRSYLCIRGGVRTDPVLSSRSTHATSGLGSEYGRTLRAGDTLPLAPMQNPAEVHTDREAIVALVRTLFTTRLRVVGPIEQTDAVVDRQSDRVGIRLIPAAPTPATEPIASEAMHHGAIQATPDGALIALGPDCATTGGYPVVASVIGADLPALGQLRQGDRVTLQPVPIPDARDLLREQERALDRAVTPAQARPR